MNPVRREISDIKRFNEIIRILVSEETSFILDKLDLNHHIPFTKRIQMNKEVPPPERLRNTLEELGTTFIKFGQIMAQRPDILPQRYTEELQKLEDSVEPFSSQKAQKIVDEEIGLENFQDFHEEPIAAASIAQVHEATTQEGEQVAVKIRRPEVEKKVEKDLEILQFLSRRAEKHSERLKHLQVSDITSEFEEWTRNELNLDKERRNAERLQRNLEEEEMIKIPETYPELTSEKVFTMEHIEGVKCTNEEGLRDLDIDAREIAETSIRAGLKQSIRDGFFHADPHPSNFLIMENSKLAYIDFGMMGQLSKKMRTKLGLLFIYTANEDVEGAVNTVKDMAHLEPEADIEALRADLDKRITLIKNSTLDEHSISKEMFEMAVKSGEYGVHMPTSFALVGKSMMTVEGIGLTIYPEFQMGDEYSKMAQKIVLKNNTPDPKSPIIDMIQNKDMIEKPFTKLRQDNQDRDINVTVEQKDKRGNEMITASLLLGGIFLISHQDPNMEILGSAALAVAGYQLLKQL